MQYRSAIVAFFASKDSLFFIQYSLGRKFICADNRRINGHQRLGAAADCRFCLSSTFELREDFLSMEKLATGTPGKDIFIDVNNACIRYGLDLKYLRCICSNGAPAMTSNQLGFVARFSDYFSNEYSNKQLINLHCIIHQEALCAECIALNTI